MIKRVVEISNPARLRLKDRQMVVEREGKETVRVPVEDLGVLILDHPAVTHTQMLLAACFENDVAVIVCNEKHMPCAMLLPLESNSLQSRTMARQIQITEPTRKRLWKSIVQAKIREQGKVLQRATGDNYGFQKYAARVRSGDPENMEAQVARIYWGKLFGPDFRRRHSAVRSLSLTDYQAVRCGDPTALINSLLNYGYAVMRAAVARALVATGLHPSLGLHHHNQYNSFCLADDLLEPLRPAVDIKVKELSNEIFGDTELTADIKQSLLEILSQESSISGRCLPLMMALHYYVASLRKVICGEEKRLEIPGL